MKYLSRKFLSILLNPNKFKMYMIQNPVVDAYADENLRTVKIFCERYQVIKFCIISSKNIYVATWTHDIESPVGFVTHIIPGITLAHVKSHIELHNGYCPIVDTYGKSKSGMIINQQT